MADSLRIDLYCEDDGHERFVSALVDRLLEEHDVAATLDTVSGRGGHGKAIAEFRGWQRRAAKGGLAIPDLLVIVIDTNCSQWGEVVADVRKIDPAVFPRSVIGSPDPHVERWCMADPESFKDVVGAPPKTDPGKCERSAYKRLLRQSILDAGNVITTNEMEYAPDLVEAMDLFRAGKRQPSLGNFVDDLGASIKQLK